MTIPQTNFTPPFNITRASHIVLTVADLAACRRFYEEVIGLVVSDADSDIAYLRGVEEIAHHSLVLKKARGGDQVCERLGFRVFNAEELEKAKAYFDSKGVPAEWVDEPYQGLTLLVRDRLGTPIELCSSMSTLPRLHVGYERHRGAGALRYDHVQVVVPDVVEAAAFYTELGFRISDYFTDDAFGGRAFGIFLFRKDNPHDLVFLTRGGPRMHHFGYVVPESHDLFRACDIAGNLGFGQSIERGLGRHGQGHQLFVYFRDPAGHRVEILPPPIQIIDLEDGPVEWEQKERFTWGWPPPLSWLEDATRFADVEVREPAVQQPSFSLEDYLAQARG
jgi:catechol 2,3-dioxygenase